MKNDQKSTVKTQRAQIFQYQKEKTERQLNLKKNVQKVLCPYTKDWESKMTFKTDKYTI